MRHHLVRSTGVALTLSLSLALAGCGGSDDEPESAAEKTAPSATTGSTPQASEDAAGDAATAPGATQAPEGKATGKSAPATRKASEPATGDDLTQLLSDSMKKGRTATVKMTASGASDSTISGVVDYGTNPPSMSLTSKVEAMGGQESQIILVDDAMYMDMGELSGGKFLRMPLDGESAQMLDLTQLDPATAFKDLYGGLTSVKARGEEKVRGEQLRRFDAKVSTAKLAKELPKEAAGSLPSTILYSFWFDDADMVRQVSVDMGKAGKTTMTYDNWGKKVTIKAPPADQVTEMPSTPQMPEQPKS